jgi:hypothetical protein
MKFSNLYPDAKHFDQFDFEGDTIVFDEEHEKLCAVCENLTRWYSISFGAWFCSEKCNRKMWSDYFDALQKGI